MILFQREYSLNLPLSCLLLSLLLLLLLLFVLFFLFVILSFVATAFTWYISLLLVLFMKKKKLLIISHFNVSVFCFFCFFIIGWNELTETEKKKHKNANLKLLPTKHQNLVQFNRDNLRKNKLYQRKIIVSHPLW